MAREGLDRQMARQCLKTGNDKAQLPLESHTHDAANAVQQKVLEQQTCVQSPRVIWNEGMAPGSRQMGVRPPGMDESVCRGDGERFSWMCATDPVGRHANDRCFLLTAAG